MNGLRVNGIKIKQRPQIGDIKLKIVQALKRKNDVVANSIKVTVLNGRVTLDSKVNAWYARDLAGRMTWSAPGVTAVEDRNHFN